MNTTAMPIYNPLAFLTTLAAPLNP
jgi:hypothetical protein